MWNKILMICVIDSRVISQTCTFSQTYLSHFVLLYPPFSFCNHNIPSEPRETMLKKLFRYYIFFFRVIQISTSFTCHKDLKLNWTTSISDSPVVSAPLLVKLNNAESSQLVVATYDGSVSIVNTASGEEDVQWPVRFPDKAFLAGPLIYDIDQDGSMDILLTSSDGEILFLSQDGTLMASHSIVLPSLAVKRKWNILPMDVVTDEMKKPDLNPSSNTLFITVKENREHYRRKLAKEFVVVDTHILSTPVIGDFNGDGVNSELIIPVNYYFEDDVKNDPERLRNLSLKKSDIDFYLATGMIIVDLRSKEIVFNVTFELTMKSSDFPGYLLSSPTVVDLDGSYGEPEVIIGSLSGRIHVYNKDGQYSHAFGLTDSIHGQITVGDLNRDGKLEVIVVDGSANVICYSNEEVMWEASVSGSMTAGAQLEDINHDSKMEVLIPTNDGYIWVLDGQSGEVLPNWPLKLGNEIHSHVLFSKHSDNSMDIVVMSDGNLNIVNGRSHCLEVIATEEISNVPVIFDPNSMAYIVSTNDGVVLSFQQQKQIGNFSWKKQTRIAFTTHAEVVHVVTASSFEVEFEIYDDQDKKHRWKSYNVIIRLSTERGVEHHVSHYDKPGFYSVTLRAPAAPKQSYILLEMCNQFKYCTDDLRYIMFHPKTEDHLILYIVLPFLVMTSLLLVLHGYPEGNLLPVWESSKKH